MEKYKEINLSENSIQVLQRRYLKKDKNGHIVETPRQLFIRVAEFIALADKNYGADSVDIEKTALKFYHMMANFDFLPNSPTLMNAGKELGQLSACFVLPVGDSMEEIFETNKHAALIHKTGGGTGFSFSRLRPRNSRVASTSGVASGPVSFMKVYNASTEAVKQGGTRRGANMGILRVDHPDIYEFISCKEDTREITNFNISVGITDAFFDAYYKKEKFPLVNPLTGKVHERDGKKMFVNPVELFDLIVEHAWMTGEPGIVFLDRMNKGNPTYPFETIEATNPCGEQPLPPYDSCNLGSINLGNFVTNDKSVDWAKLAGSVRTAVHFLDNVIDQNKYPLKEIEIQTKKNRRIGLGVMGWADMLIKMRHPYNSEKALNLAGEIMKFIHSESSKHSSELAKSRGKFLNWEHSIYQKQNVSMRNATLTTIAPTGTISIIANCSSGIEPYYALAYERNVLEGIRLAEMNSLLKDALKSENLYSEELIEKIKSKRSISGINELPENIKSIFLTAEDITPEEHIKMQAEFQKYSDSSVSKTINFSESSTMADVKTAFLKAFELNCKGITIYRDNSRPMQVLSLVADGEENKTGLKHFKEKRPTKLNGFTEKIKTAYGNLYVTVNIKNNKPFEVFAQIGKSGYSTMADTEAICRLISISLRSGVDMSEIIKQLKGIGGSMTSYSNGVKVVSIPDAIAQVLHRNFSFSRQSSGMGAEICPDCSGVMIYSSGCFTCQNCGYSSC